MIEYSVPFGKDHAHFHISEEWPVDLILPRETSISRQQEIDLIEKALLSPLEIEEDLLFHDSDKTVAIAINDQTRPIPYEKILPPLLMQLENRKISTDNITFFIATGTHKSLSADEIKALLPSGITDKYRTLVHNCNEENNLTFLGFSSIGTPIFINSLFYRHDIKIVVGHIEPHHFMGFSGGVKSAVIGLGGRKTIEANHKVISDANAKMGKYFTNPMRKDIEEIGKLIGINLAFNVVLNSSKNIQDAYFGDPYAVMKAGIKTSINNCVVENDPIYDLVIASPGGYPKDINLYQAQKALTHGSAFLKKGGVLILAAECIDGTGNTLFEAYMSDKLSFQQVIAAFESDSFRVGPHKAYQIALQLADNQIFLVSMIDREIVEKILLNHAKNIDEAIYFSQIKGLLPMNPKTAILPFATHVIPNYLFEEI